MNCSVKLISRVMLIFRANFLQECVCAPSFRLFGVLHAYKHATSNTHTRTLDHYIPCFMYDSSLEYKPACSAQHTTTQKTALKAAAPAAESTRN